MNTITTLEEYDGAKMRWEEIRLVKRGTPEHDERMKLLDLISAYESQLETTLPTLSEEETTTILREDFGYVPRPEEPYRTPEQWLDVYGDDIIRAMQTYSEQEIWRLQIDLANESTTRKVLINKLYHRRQEELPPGISIDPQIRLGKPCIIGTRISVGDVLVWLSAGMERAAIMDDFNLTEENITAALTFAAQVLE